MQAPGAHLVVEPRGGMSTRFSDREGRGEVR